MNFRDEIAKKPTLGDVIKFTQETYPDMTIEYFSGFCKTQEQLNQKWIQMCDSIGTNTKLVLLLDISKYNTEPEILYNLAFIAEILTSQGFVIKHISEYKKCECCGDTRIVKI